MPQEADPRKTGGYARFLKQWGLSERPIVQDLETRSAYIQSAIKLRTVLQAAIGSNTNSGTALRSLRLIAHTLELHKGLLRLIRAALCRTSFFGDRGIGPTPFCRYPNTRRKP